MRVIVAAAFVLAHGGSTGSRWACFDEAGKCFTLAIGLAKWLKAML
jgi:hypothetical protein